MNRFGPYRLGDRAAMIEKRSSSATSSLTSCPGICLCLWSRASKTKIQRHELLLRDASKTCDERSCGSSINPGRTHPSSPCGQSRSPDSGTKRSGLRCIRRLRTASAVARAPVGVPVRFRLEPVHALSDNCSSSWIGFDWVLDDN
ncbi:hypothetical protein DTO195F2_3824 [Paecilomyces variotii]|nr:hypothetical protein DTO195F2_3824 [Paecilomyces variotii]